MQAMPVSPKAPTVGAGAKTGHKKIKFRKQPLFKMFCVLLNFIVNDEVNRFFQVGFNGINTANKVSCLGLGITTC